MKNQKRLKQLLKELEELDKKFDLGFIVEKDYRRIRKILVSQISEIQYENSKVDYLEYEELIKHTKKIRTSFQREGLVDIILTPFDAKKQLNFINKGITSMTTSIKRYERWRNAALKDMTYYSRYIK